MSAPLSISPTSITPPVSSKKKQPIFNSIDDRFSDIAKNIVETYSELEKSRQTMNVLKNEADHKKIDILQEEIGKIEKLQQECLPNFLVYNEYLGMINKIKNEILSIGFVA